MMRTPLQRKAQAPRVRSALLVGSAGKRLLPLALVAALGLAACGGRPLPPPNGVYQHDVSSWNYRRFQKLLDIEVWVRDNHATAFTASYVRGAAEKAGALQAGDVVNVFVTRYQKAAGVLRAVVVFTRRLAQEQGYAVEEAKVESVRLFRITGHGESWALWAAGNHVVKIGGREVTAIPEALVEAYGKPYPSSMDSGLLEGALPPDTENHNPNDKPKYDPENPSPDWDNYKAGEIETL